MNSLENIVTILNFQQNQRTLNLHPTRSNNFIKTVIVTRFHTHFMWRISLHNFTINFSKTQSCLI